MLDRRASLLAWLAVVLFIGGLIAALYAPVLAVVGLIVWGWQGWLCILLAVVLAIGGLIILINWVLFPETVESYPDGHPKARGEHYHGDKQGTWTFWYASGQVESQGQFVGG